jgi:hypothetical protein
MRLGFLLSACVRSPVVGGHGLGGVPTSAHQVMWRSVVVGSATHPTIWAVEAWGVGGGAAELGVYVGWEYGDVSRLAV